MQRNVSGSYRVAIMANSEKPEKLSLVWLSLCVKFWANRKSKHLKDIIFWRQKVAFFLAKPGKRASRVKEHLEIYWVLFWLAQTHNWLLCTWNESTTKPKQKETPKYFYTMFQYILLCLRSQQIYSTLPSACGLRKYVIANQPFSMIYNFATRVMITLD